VRWSACLVDVAVALAMAVPFGIVSAATGRGRVVPKMTWRDGEDFDTPLICP
jgi:hypothetical protein